MYLKLFKVKDNTAKIADIGMSKSENLLHGTITGTPVFMAPEVLEGRMYGRSADIFSLAIMMWEMWYGRRVFSEILSFAVLTSCPSIKVMLKMYFKITYRYIINSPRILAATQFSSPEKLNIKFSVNLNTSVIFSHFVFLFLPKHMTDFY